ncbi:MAG: sulfotransferase [Proteobacteria bacterium]|nr:sulfotransferase [Pseudomonadota bacterium]
MTVGRNDPCPCGSGRRFKQCCGAIDTGDVRTLRGRADRHLGTGALNEAVAGYRQVLALAPQDAESLFNLAQALELLGERAGVLDLLQRAVAAAPESAGGHSRLGHALLHARRVTEARASFEAALARDPRHVDALLGLASAQRVSGMAQAARASCQAALQADPHHARALALSGELHADSGDFAQARTLFEQALARDANLVSAYAGLAGLRRMGPGDEAWRTGAHEVLARGVSRTDEVTLRFALGKYFDDIAQYEQAFDSYRRANELARQGAAPYDRGKLERMVENLVTLSTQLREHPIRGLSAEQPVLIIGMPRSGTSLAEQILASHSQVRGAGEVRFWDDAYTAMGRALRAGGDLGEPLRVLARDYLQVLATRAGEAPRLIDKMPANFLYGALIHAALPRARFIHMQRDPRDTCLSIYFQNFYNVSPYAYDLDDLAHYYTQYRRLLTQWRKVLPRDRLLEVPYESLVADQEGWTRRMLEFLGLPWDERCLSFERTERTVITASRWQVRQKLHSGSIGRWRHYQQHLGPLQRLVTGADASAAAT